MRRTRRSVLRVVGGIIKNNHYAQTPRFYAILRRGRFHLSGVVLWAVGHFLQSFFLYISMFWEFHKVLN